MTPSLEAVTPGGTLHRIGRDPDPWAWPPWSYAGDDGTFGNRYDDPVGDYRVLYASSQRIGSFLETLARYRTDPAVVAEYAEIAVDDEDQENFPTFPPGLVPRDWPKKRRIGSARHAGRFADVGHSSSLSHLRVAMASRLLHYGLDDLDGGDLRRRAPRALTQEISRHVFEHDVSDHGDPLIGIRYLSRLGDDLENWAIFEGTEPEDATSEPIAEDDPDLLDALDKLDLELAPR